MSFETSIMRDISKLVGLLGIGIIIGFGLVLGYIFIAPEIGYQMSAYEAGFTPCDRVGDMYIKEDHWMGSSAGWNFGNWKLCNSMDEFYLFTGIILISIIIIVILSIKIKTYNYIEHGGRV